MAHPNLVEILAHLDFLLEGHVWRSLPDRGIIHMHKMLVDLADKLGGGYTVDQIRERLWQEFQHGYKYPEHNFPQLFLHGSSEMQNLDPKTRKLVEERLIVIRLNAAFHAPRSLRSKSVATTSVALPNIDTRNTSTPTPPSAKSSKRNRRTSSVQKNAPRKKNMPSKARHRAKLVSRSRTTPSTAIVLSTEIDETPVYPNSGYDDDNNIASRSHGTYNSPCLPAISAERYADMISQLTQYKHRCECHERETKDIKNQMRQMESLYALTRGIPEKMLKEFRNKTRQITDLKKQLHGEIDLVPYFSTQQAHVGVLITQRLLTGFKDMKDQLASIVVANGTSKLLVDSLYGQSADLDVLLRTVFDVGIRSNMEQTSNASPDLTLHELIQALTGAAIHCWVFESMYRPTAMTNTPLLQKYRDHLVDLWAPEDLYSLDTAVHYSMIEEKDFENVTIPSMASRHTIRLSNALQPLFKKQLQSRMTKKLQSRMTKKLRHTLDDILRLALKIRSLSLVGTEEYESIWPSSGSLVDNNEMDMQHSRITTMANLVRLPISPGLRGYPKKKAMVGYHPFGNWEGSSRTPKLVIKALVIT